MVKCPRRTLLQTKGNLAYVQRPTAFSAGDDFSWIYDPSQGQMVFVGDKDNQTLAERSEEQELDSNKADRRCPPTPRDEVIKLFVSSFLDILLLSWEGKPCAKPKLGEPEEFGAESTDLSLCEDSTASSKADSLKDLFRKKSSNLSSENSPANYKQKTRADSTEAEYPNEGDFESSTSSMEWKTFVPDEDVHFVLLNGVWYKGRVSGRLMEGEGVYFWEDGSTYQGEFVGGSATGRGRMEFSDLSAYEGDVHEAFRHGEGLHCFADSPLMYCGQWWLGKKHGQGLMMYGDPSKEANFYRGQWQDGTKEGFGFREYPSGAKYVGFWSDGKRHGKGVMFWSNRDIYRGYWKEGLMHGYGEYTWNGFVNRSLSYPATNTYRGFWSEGKRCGRGFFEVKNGALIETVWADDAKEGPGAVICCNGTLVAAERLFSKDKQGLFDDQEDNTGLLLRDQASVMGSGGKKARNEEHLLAYVSSSERAKAISIPIHSPVHSINLRVHVQKYYAQRKERLRDDVLKRFPDCQSGRGKEVQAEEASQEEYHCRLSKCMAQEEKCLRNFILARISDLKACYDHYATVGCEKPPTFRCVLLRMFLWQMLIDGEIPRSDLSLVDVDDMLAQEEYLLIENAHDPFERIQFWQFVHILIRLSWHFYGQYVLAQSLLVAEERLVNFLQYFRDFKCKNVLKAAFEYFLEDLFRGRFRKEINSHLGRSDKFEESDLAPLEAMYAMYREVGEPHSARDFVNAICQKSTRRRETPDIVKYFEKLPFYKMDGKNAFTVAGELNHLPGPEPFNFPQIFPLEEKIERGGKWELSRFSGLKARGVIRCLIQVCPGIFDQNLVVNIDYKLTFLEFYKAVVVCAELTLKKGIMKEKRDSVIREYKSQLEEYERQVEEYEKMKEKGDVSRKKSRQFSDMSKKGRK